MPFDVSEMVSREIELPRIFRRRYNPEKNLDWSNDQKRELKNIVSKTIEHRLGALKLLQRQGVFSNSIEHVFDAGLECSNTGTGGLSGQMTVAGRRNEAEGMLYEIRLKGYDEKRVTIVDFGHGCGDGATVEYNRF